MIIRMIQAPGYVAKIIGERRSQMVNEITPFFSGQQLGLCNQHLLTIKSTHCLPCPNVDPCQQNLRDLPPTRAQQQPGHRTWNPQGFLLKHIAAGASIQHANRASVRVHPKYSQHSKSLDMRSAGSVKCYQVGNFTEL